MQVFLIRREAGLVLFLGGDFQHVRVVPVAGAGVGTPFVLAQPARAHGGPVGFDITGGAPAVGKRANGGTVGDVHVVGEAEHDVAAAVAQGVIHLARLGIFDGIPVVFKIVNAPGGPLRRVVGGEGIFADGPGQGFFIDHLFAGGLGPRAFGIFRAAADMRGVGGGPRRRIDADLKPEAVDIVTKFFDVRKFLVPLNGVERPAACTLPGVVNVHIGPAMINQAGVRHGLRILQHDVLRDA